MLCEANITAKTDERRQNNDCDKLRAADTPTSILLVEDVACDALLTRIALNDSAVPYTLETLRKGNHVLPFLHEQERKRNLPDIIMLDLGLPCLDGFDVLDEMAHASANIRALPIVILTGHHFEYVRKIYNLWIPAYINKPCDSGEIRKVLSLVRPN